eukprot:s259_g28.t1
MCDLHCFWIFYSVETREPGLQRMIQVMHWAIKQLRKQRLQSARCISISVDDRQDFRILRYRCDLQEAGALPRATGPRSMVQYPEASAGLEDWCNVGPAAAEGILGVFRIGQDCPENTLESHNKDKSEAMADSVEEMLRRACQDPEGVVDNEALQHIRNHIFHFSSDQGSVAKFSQPGCQILSGSAMIQLIKSESLTGTLSMLFQLLKNNGRGYLLAGMHLFLTYRTVKCGEAGC